MFGKNTKFEIKTPNGWESFYGVQKLSNKNVVDVILESGKHISVSTDHRFYEKRLGYCDVKALYSGDKIKTIDGFETIISIIPRHDMPDVYDVVEVGKNHFYYTNDILSHNCEFLGSSNTLISAAKIQQLMASMEEPIKIEGNIRFYEMPKPNQTYAIIVDVAEGLGLDYSTYSVVDVTNIPYKQVAIFKDNQIKPILLPAQVVSMAKRYNEAFVLVEINSIGLQVADMIHYDMAYENLIKIQSKGKQGQQWTAGHKKNLAFGIKTSVQTKQIGCTNLKAMIESDKLTIRDEGTIKELTTFAVDKRTYKAEQGSNDDLVMTLVNFAWLMAQKFFRESMNNDIRRVLQEEQLHIMDQDIVPFGIIDNGLDDPWQNTRDDQGNYWIEDRQKMYPFDDFNWDWRHKL